MHPRFSRLPRFVLLCFVLCAGLVHADELQDINKLVTKGQLGPALDKVNAYLVSHPKDPQARFTRGIVLTELNKSNEAIQVFTSLTEDFPELPEPYNNLAVIYASQGDYDKARNALELAIHTHPSYATAHENLGDIYAKLASRSYDKALQLDRANTGLQTKLALIKDMFAPVKAPADGGKAERAKGEAPKAEPARTDAPAAEPLKNEPEKSDSVKPGAPKTDAAKPDTAKAGNGKTEKAAANTDAGSDAVVATVMAWAQAWSDKSPDTYLAHYSSVFRTPNQETRAAWERQRRERLSKPGPIVVKVRDPKVSFNGPDKATVSFQQDYSSSNLKVTSRKVLLLQKDGDKWQIVQERVGS